MPSTMSAQQSAPALAPKRQPGPATVVTPVVQPVPVGRRELPRQFSAYSARTTTLSSGVDAGIGGKMGSPTTDRHSADICSPDVVFGGVRWCEAGRIYLLIGGLVCAIGVVTLLGTAIGHNGPVWIGSIIVCIGLMLLGKGIFDYIRARVKAEADRPDAEDFSSTLGSGGGGLFALPFGSSRSREKRQTANFKYLTTSSAYDGNSWATEYRHQGTLQPLSQEMVQTSSMLLTGGAARPMHTITATPTMADYYYRRPPSRLSMRSSMTSSCGHHEPVYFPVLSTSRLPTPQESPYPSVFSLQDATARRSRGGGGGGIRLTRPSSGASAPSLFDSLRVSESRGGGGLFGPGLAAPVVGRSSRIRLLPSQGARRLTSHKEEL